MSAWGGELISCGVSRLKEAQGLRGSEVALIPSLSLCASEPLSLRVVPRRQRKQILRAELVLAAAELAGDLGAAFGDHFFELAAVEEGEGGQGAFEEMI